MTMLKGLPHRAYVVQCRPASAVTAGQMADRVERVVSGQATPVHTAHITPGVVWHPRGSLLAATPQCEMKRHGAWGYSNDGMAMSPGGYAASNITGATYAYE